MSRFSIPIRRFLNNFAANAFGQVMNGVYQIISVPLFLLYWNKQGYGEWLVLFSIPSLLWSLEGGLAGVAANRMTVAASAGNWELVNSIFQNVLLIQGIFSGFLVAGAIAIASALNLGSYFGFTQTSNSETSTIIVLLIGYMLTGFCLSLFRAAYRASALEARGVMANNLWRLVEFGVVVVVLVSHGHAVLLTTVMLLCVLISTTLVYIDVRRTCRRIEFGLVRASWSQTKTIVRDGLPLLSGQAAAAFLLQGYPLVINRALGASLVVTFVTIRSVSRTVLLFLQVISLSSAPEVSRSYGRKDWEVYLRLLKIMLASAIGGGVITLLVLTLFGPWIIAKWTAGKVIVDHAPMLLFGLSIALQGMWAVGGVVLVCSNMHHLFNYLYLFVTIGGLFLANAITPIWGFTAIPVTLVLQDTLLLVIVIMLCQSKLSHIRLRDLGSVFTFTFYRKHIETAWNRFIFVSSK
jgi:O-antigen/teichoic acid export membrane protein